MSNKIKNDIVKYTGIAQLYQFASSTVRSLVNTSIELDNSMASLRAATGLSKDQIAEIHRNTPFSLHELKRMALGGHDLKKYLKNDK